MRISKIADSSSESKSSISPCRRLYVGITTANITSNGFRKDLVLLGVSRMNCLFRSRSASKTEGLVNMFVVFQVYLTINIGFPTATLSR